VQARLPFSAPRTHPVGELAERLEILWPLASSERRQWGQSGWAAHSRWHWTLHSQELSCSSRVFFCSRKPARTRGVRSQWVPYVAGPAHRHSPVSSLHDPWEQASEPLEGREASGPLPRCLLAHSLVPAPLFCRNSRDVAGRLSNTPLCAAALLWGARGSLLWSRCCWCSRTGAGRMRRLPMGNFPQVKCHKGEHQQGPR